MVEPLTIAAFAFATVANSEPGKKFIEATIGKVAEKFTETAIQKMNELRQVIWNKLRGIPDAETALKQAETGSENAIRDVADLVSIAMRKDQAFAEQVGAIVKTIYANQIQGDHGQIQNIYDQGTGIQSQTYDQGKTYNAQTINIHET